MSTTLTDLTCDKGTGPQISKINLSYHNQLQYVNSGREMSLKHMELKAYLWKILQLIKYET